MHTKSLRVFCLTVAISFCVLLCVGCGELVAPNVSGRPEYTISVDGYTPPVEQTAYTESDVQNEPPAFWKGQSQTLPADLVGSSAAEPESSGAEPSGTGTADSGNITEPPTPTTSYIPPNLEGEGRGDAYDLVETDKNGQTVIVNCTPFF